MAEWLWERTHQFALFINVQKKKKSNNNEKTNITAHYTTFQDSGATLSIKKKKFYQINENEMLRKNTCLKVLSNCCMTCRTLH